MADVANWDENLYISRLFNFRSDCSLLTLVILERDFLFYFLIEFPDRYRRHLVFANPTGLIAREADPSDFVFILSDEGECLEFVDENRDHEY